MPTKPLHACTAPRCSNLTDQRHCPDHRAAEWKQRATPQRSPSARGYGWKWQEASKGYLAKHPLCVCCPGERIHAAEVVDHIIPHKLSEAKTPEEIARATRLFWDSANNWQSSCRAANARKCARAEGGFGNRRAS